MQDSIDVDTSDEKKKPELILFYNANKVGVDCFDQMTCLCTTRSASWRWPVAVWGNILDIAAINSYLLYKRVNKQSHNTPAVHTNACRKPAGQAKSLSEQQQ